jgi:MSHA biogenesis protein MshL
MKKLVIIFICFFFVASCVEKKFTNKFDSNIDKFNEFYNPNPNFTDDNLVNIENDIYEPPECYRASIHTNNISLKNLAKLLSKLYNENVSYIGDEKNNPSINLNNPKPIASNSKNTIPPLADQNNVDNINLNMKDVCIYDVFDNLTELYNIGVDKMTYGYITYHKKLKTETFPINYHNFYRKGKSSISIVNSQLKSDADQQQQSYSAITTESAETFWNSITKTIRSILSVDTERKLSLDSENSEQNLEDFYVYKESGLIVVTAYPRQLQYIKRFLSKVNNTSTQQVLIEAKILEIELTDEFSNGVQWDLLKKKLYFSSFSAANGLLQGVNDVHNTKNFSSENNLVSGILSAQVNNKNNFNIVMQALSAQGKVSVISSPRILALNNQRALIKSGEDKYFVTNVNNLTLNSLNSSNITSNSGFDLEPFFSGLALDTTAHIINNQEVLLHIHPMISRVNDENKLITIDNKDTKIPVATVQSREADTVVKAKSGDIIILGGMTQDLVKLNQTGLPFEGQKVVGKLLDTFSAKKHSTTKVELIILLKPTIITINDLNNRGDLATFDQKNY